METKQTELIERAKIITEALPYISRYRGKTVVIKYGGNAMNDPSIIKTIMQDVATLKIVGVHPLLVHGGGPEINTLLKRLNISSRFENGLRITDAATMEVVQMALGKLNKNIAAALCTLGVNAVGVSGQDDGLIRVEKYTDGTSTDYGYVGKITDINCGIIRELSDKGYIPVIATVGADRDGRAYNVNADTAAGAIGGAVQAEKLLYLTDVDGVRENENDPASLIPEITVSGLRAMIADGRIRGGMVPKAQSCIQAIECGVNNVLILNGTIPHSILLELFTHSGVGTMVVPDKKNKA